MVEQHVAISWWTWPYLIFLNLFFYNFGYEKKIEFIYYFSNLIYISGWMEETYF